jgi:hypothetical protein
VNGKMSNLILKDNAMTIEFVKDKETKNTIRFTASGDISGSVYVKKDSELAKESVISMEISKKIEVSA